MAIDFPAAPTVGQTYAYAGVTYTYTAQGVWSTTSLAPIGFSVNVQVFPANGVYTPSANMVTCIVECIGGGGGGGGASPTNASNLSIAAGGGGGGYALKRLTAAQVGASQTVTVGPGGVAGNVSTIAAGAGGTSSFGSLCSASGGQAGANIGVAQAAQITGIPGGIGLVGDVLVAGGPSTTGSGSVAVNFCSTSNGGDAANGGGGGTSGLNVGANPGRLYGGGGGGGANFASQAERAGGAGAAGIVIVTEYGGIPGPVGPQGPPGSAPSVGFRAWTNGVAQSLPTGALTKINFGTEEYDQGGYYNPANSRWTPPAGIIHIDASIMFSNSLSPSGTIDTYVLKNGVALKTCVIACSQAFGGGQISVDDVASGTDYYEIAAAISTPTTAPLNVTTVTWFSGHVVAGAGPQGLAGAGALNAGRLTLLSATQLEFKPYNGNQIKINGQIYAIPNVGIVGLNNTGIFLNGVAGQNLAINTLYYVYAFVNGGVVTGDFSVTTHATSVLAGNEGVEIKNGDNSRTLIGMVYTTAAGQFVDNLTQRFVLSWFNRRNLPIQIAPGNFASTNPTTPTVGPNPAQALNWGDEPVHMTGGAQCVSSGSYGSVHIVVDTVSVVHGGSTYVYGGMPNNVPIYIGGWKLHSENGHTYYGAAAADGGGTITVNNLVLNGMTRG